MLRLPERFQEKIHLEYDSGCWIWVGWGSGNGYGKVSMEGRAWMAHRAVYTLLVGPIPEDHVLDHRCRVRACCNPEHVEPVTGDVNTYRGRAVLFGRAVVLERGHENEMRL